MYRFPSPKPLLVFATSLLLAVMHATVRPAAAQLRLGGICHVKGQEENFLQGLGLVVGLNGTGDGDMEPTSRALASMLSLMGSPLPRGADGEEMLKELADAQNVALVMVTVTIPATGARQGDKLHCHVSAISAESLDGGYLMTTALLGPRPGSARVYGFAQGPIHLDDETRSAAGKIHEGCRLEEEFFNVYSLDGWVTLVLNQDHASFQTAQEVANVIDAFFSSRLQGSFADAGQPIVRAIDQMSIEVRIPPQYLENPVDFVSQILELPILKPPSEPRVVINERAGTVVFGAEVVIGPVAITHNGLAIETGATANVSHFAAIDQTGRGATRLESLVEALNLMKVPPGDIIEIIKGIERNGKLYGRLIIE